MRLSSIFIALTSFVLGAVLCIVAAGFAVTKIEETSEIGVRHALDEANYGWAEVQADGLQVILTGKPDGLMRSAGLAKWSMRPES